MCKDVKIISEFHKSKKTKDGHVERCKGCRKIMNKLFYQNNKEYKIKWQKEYYKKNKDKIIEYQDKYRENNKDKIREHNKNYIRNNPDYLLYHKKYREDNPEIEKAHNLFKSKYRSGKIKKLPCKICGGKKSEAHHPDYSKPYDVIWLCSKHHKQVHSGRIKIES